VGLEGGPSSVALWGVQQGRLLRRLAVTGFVSALAFRPDGRALAVADPATAAVQLFDTASGAALRQRSLPSGAPAPTPPTLGGLAFRGDGACLVAEGGGVVDVYDPAGGAPSIRLPSSQHIYRVEFSPAGALLAFHEAGIERWDLRAVKGEPL